MTESMYQGGPTLDQFISALPSARDAVLRENRRRIFACQNITVGMEVRVNGHSHVAGVVVSVTPARFVVQFPGGIGGHAKSWTRCFRKKDGRSVGGKIYTWASPLSSRIQEATP